MDIQNKDKLKNAELILPPYLHALEYFKYPCIVELAQRSVFVKPERVDFDPIWFYWRGIFEYLSCVEYARYMLCSLPIGNDIRDKHGLPARYNSASLVFFAQATLDNMAIWIARHFPIKSKGSNIAFHSKLFVRDIKSIDVDLGGIIEKHLIFIEILRNYRMEWIHRISGGATTYSDKIPSDPTRSVMLAVPINPKINHFELGGKQYHKLIEECRQQNDGKWLYPIGDFADMLRDGTKGITIDILTRALDLISST